jgi:HlyD family secretion protein
MTNTEVSLQDLLGGSAENDARRRKRSLRRRVIMAVAAVLVIFVAVWISSKRSSRMEYATDEITRGSLTVTVSATGSLQPTNQVDVGSELSGVVDSVMVEENEGVTAGQVLARLDTSRLRDQVVGAEGALAAAQAQVLQASAGAEEARKRLGRLRRVSERSDGRVPSRTELESAAATAERTAADISAAQASVLQAEASLESARTNLSKATIRSPVDGVVLVRNVDPGQTLAASLQTPVLFVIAEDLSRMELTVDVDEADVGAVRAGQRAIFSVDAYPGREYSAQILRVGYGAQPNNGVVSYKTVLKVDNDDLSLRPGMTATAEITTDEVNDVLLAPSAALRFEPAGEEDAGRSQRGMLSSLVPHVPDVQTSIAAQEAGPGAKRVLWTLRDGDLAPLLVTAWATDGQLTEVRGENLHEGLHVVTAQMRGRR